MSFISSKLRATKNTLLAMYGASSLHQKQQLRIVRSLAEKKPVKVVFFAMNVAMWRYQHVYDKMKADPRFKVYLVLSPLVQLAREQCIQDLKSMRSYFGQRGMEFVDWKLEDGEEAVDVRKTIDPDILFYTQQFDKRLTSKHEYERFLDKLLCLIPYGIGPLYSRRLYDTSFHNLAWKLYYPSPDDLVLARKLARTKGGNVVVSGYSIYDDYKAPALQDPWKPLPGKKRIIWAPHFTLPNSPGHYHRANFLWMAEVMIELARKYEDSLQFVFKPHPKLLTELYAHPDWGKQRTDDYYHLWQTMPNTQLMTGEFINLFKSSDAMIHDCGSFMVEYLFVDKPVLYVNQHPDMLRESLPQLGKLAIDAHYMASDLEQINTFVNQVVLGGNDTKQQARKLFYDRYLLPSHNEGVGEFIYHDICNSLFSENND